MNIYALGAGLLAVAVSLIHSVLGEKLIFSSMRRGGIVPTDGQPLLGERRVRILWATWHLASIMGIGFAAVLFRVARPFSQSDFYQFVLVTVIAVMLCSSALVLYATKGKHPGWVGLLGVAFLTWLSWVSLR